MEVLILSIPVVVCRIIPSWAWAVFGLELQLACAIWDEKKIGSFINHWMRNGGHQTWGKAIISIDLLI